MPNYSDLMTRTQRAMGLFLDCSLALSKAARWSFRGPFFELPITPGHWFARRARALFASAMAELSHVRSQVTVDLPDVEVPRLTAVLGEELATWLGFRPRLGSTQDSTLAVRWEYAPFAFQDTSLTFEQRMETSRVEVEELVDRTGELLARLRHLATA